MPPPRAQTSTAPAPSRAPTPSGGGGTGGGGSGGGGSGGGGTGGGGGGTGGDPTPTPSRQTLAVPPPRARRLTQLYLGLLLYGISDGMLLLAGLGVDPWDVFHQGLSRRFGLGVGTWALIVGAFVMLLWIPLRQRPGFGTISNALLVGPVIDLMLVVFAPAHGLPLQLALMCGGVILNGVATGAYIGAGLGPGPRDGLMTGLAARGHSIRVVRTGIEVTVLVTGWLLGGTVGVGTVAYALGIGPLAHFFVPRLAIGPGAAVAEQARWAEGS